MITSTSNQQIKELLQLQKKSKARNEKKVFLVEGVKMFLEAPRERIEKVYVAETLYEKKKDMLPLDGLQVELVSDKVFAHVSDTKTPQGILCVLQQQETTIDTLMQTEQPFFIVLDNLQDPGNLGTIVRTAEGAGVNGIIMSRDTVDIYNPKTIRSTMGSIYRMPFLYADDLVSVLKELRAKGIVSYAAHLEGTHFYEEENYKAGCAFLIGNEGNGLRQEVSDEADVLVKIPMCGQVESLNAAIAASILMFEVQRQRRRT